MPNIILCTNQSLPANQKDKIAGNLLEITAHRLGKKPELTNVKINDQGSDWYSGGNRIDSEPLCHLTIFITQGSNQKQEKEAWLKDVWNLLKQELGLTGSRPNYLVIQDVDGDSWGYNGISQQQRATNEV